MYFHLVCSPKCFAVASGRKPKRNLFRQSTELMLLIDHEFVRHHISPPFALLLCPFHMGISIPFGKRLIGVFWDTHGRQKQESKSCANADSVYL